MEKDVTDKTKDEKDQTVAAESKKHRRKVGWGETIFDFGVYAGISWILNEIISTVITQAIQKKNPVALRLHDGKFYQKFQDIISSLHKNVNPFKLSRVWVEEAFTMFVMCIGGSLVVPLSKTAEDHKGTIVRWIDNKLTGGRGEADPGIKRAHEEMDAAPKQSWTSQIWGRLLVLVSAISLHFVAGAESEHYQAPTTKWLKNIAPKYSNLTRVMTTLARDIFSMKWMPFSSKEEKAAMKANRAISTNGKNFLWIQENEGKLARRFGYTFGYVLIVSAAMATLFFVSSHIIAAFKDKGKKKQDAGDAPQAQTQAPQPDAGQAKQKDQADQDKEKPTAKVAQISNHLTVGQSAPAQGVLH